MEEENDWRSLGLGSLKLNFKDPDLKSMDLVTSTFPRVGMVTKRRSPNFKMTPLHEYVNLIFMFELNIFSYIYMVIRYVGSVEITELISTLRR